MTPDCELLRCYAENRSEKAFATLVDRHLDLVYSAALRQVNGDTHLAQDITQTVFTDLARKSQQLASRTDLAGWLYTSAYFAATKAVRAEGRRRTREQEAHTMQDILRASLPGPDWEMLGPILDQAMHDLNDDDREAVVLRYFQKRQHAAIGKQFGISEDAARMRVERALEKLRDHLSRRGITATAAALSIAISANAVQAAPVGLALTVSTAAAALTGTTLATTAAVTTAKTVAMTTLQKTVVTTTIAVLAGVGIYEARQASHLREQAQKLQQQQIALTEQVQQFRNERDDAFRQLATLRQDNERVSANTNVPELLRLRGEVGLLRQTAIELNKLRQDPRLALSEDDVAKVQQMHATDTMSKLMSGIQQFATFHNGRFPKDFNELQASIDISPTDFQGNLSFDDFVFLPPDSRDFQGTPLILRNRSPIKSPRGDLVWIYGSLKSNVPSTIATPARYGD